MSSLFSVPSPSSSPHTRWIPRLEEDRLFSRNIYERSSSCGEVLPSYRIRDRKQFVFAPASAVTAMHSASALWLGSHRLSKPFRVSFLFDYVVMKTCLYFCCSSYGRQFPSDMAVLAIGEGGKHPIVPSAEEKKDGRLPHTLSCSCHTHCGYHKTSSPS